MKVYHISIHALKQHMIPHIVEKQDIIIVHILFLTTYHSIRTNVVPSNNHQHYKNLLTYNIYKYLVIALSPHESTIMDSSSTSWMPKVLIKNN